MANKLKDYTITGPDGSEYTITAAEDASDEELFEFIQSSFQSEPQESLAPVAEAPVSVPTADAPVAPTATTAAMPDYGKLTGEGTAGPTAAATGISGPAQDWKLSPEDEAAFMQMSDDPNVSYGQLQEWARAKGAINLGGSEEDLNNWRKYLSEGGARESGVGYEQVPIEQLMGTYNDQTDPDVGYIGSALEKGAAYNPLGILGRLYQDFTDAELQGGITKDMIRQLYPTLNDEGVEALHDRAIGEWRRRELSNVGYQTDVRGVDPVTEFAGDIVGGLSPIDVVPFGRGASFAGRAAEGAFSNIAADAALQASDVAYGAQDQFSNTQSLMAGAAGAAVQGVFEVGIKGAGKAYTALRGESRQDVAPGQPPAPISVPTNYGRKNSKAYKQQINTASQEIAAHANSIAGNWANAPQYVVHDNFKSIDGVDNDAIGVYDAETGQIALNTEMILEEAARRKTTPEAVTAAVTFHEGLGHYGLAQKFGDELDNTLAKALVEGTEELKARVQEWIDKNPGAYKDDPNQDLRAFEEVLADWSNQGYMPPKFVDRFMKTVKDLGRTMNMPVSYSSQEMKTILGMAHDAVVKGKGRDVIGNGFRFAKVWHGSGADFDEFDHAYMSSGEGAQVFGWGTYLTESKGIAEGYRDTIGGSKLSWDGSEAPVYDLRQYMLQDVSLDLADVKNAKDIAEILFTEATLNGGLKNVENFTVTDLADAWGFEGGIDFDAPAIKNLASDLKKVKDYFKDRLKITKKGKLYEVDIPDDANWMQWDNPSVNVKGVKEALEEAGYTVRTYPEWNAKELEYYNVKQAYDQAQHRMKTNEQLLENDRQHPIEKPEDLARYKAEADAAYRKMSELAPKYNRLKIEIANHIADNATGDEVYGRLVSRLGSPKKASLLLNKHGVEGINYPTGSLSGRPSYKPDGTENRNFVVFSDKTPKIKAKYMRPTKLEDISVGPEDKLNQDELFEVMNAKDILENITRDYVPTERSWGEAKREANSKGITPSKALRNKGVDDLDKRLFQYDALASRMSDRLSELYGRQQSGTFSAQDKAAYLQTLFQMSELTGRIFDDQAEIGRALNAMKALDFTKRKVGELNRILAEYEGNKALAGFADEESFNRFAKQIQDLIDSGNIEGAALMARQSLKPYWWQYILTFRHAMMLSGLGTHAKNAVDNANMILRELEETLLATPGSAVRKGIKATGKEVLPGVTPTEFMARAYGLTRSLLDSDTYIKAAKAFKEGHGNTEYSAKIEMQDARVPGISKVNDALYAADTFFRAFHQNANLHALGVRQAQSEGFSGIRAFEEGSAKAANPTENLLEAAKEKTDESLLVDRPSFYINRLEGLKSIRPGMKGGEQIAVFVANLLFPFFRVTDRLLFQAIRRSPLSFLDKNTREDFAAGGARRDIAIARTVYGSALMAYYWANSGEEGTIEGRGPSDYKKRQALESTGWRQNSVEEGTTAFDATALNLSTNPLDLQNNIAANVASIREAWEKGADEKDIAARLGSVSLALMQVLGSQSYAENLGQYMGLFSEGSEAQSETAAANFFGGMASSFVPAAVRQLNQQVLDPTKRDTRGDKSFGDRVEGRIKSGIPGLSEDLPIKYDFLGDEIPQGRSTLGMDNYTEIKQDPVSKAIREVEDDTEKQVLSGAPSSFKYEGEEIKLTAEQQQEWQRVQGYYIRAYMEQEVSTPEWRSMTTQDKSAVIKDVKKDAYNETKAYMLPLLGLSSE